MAKVPVQKGKIVPEQMTMKFMSRAQINKQDAENVKKIIDGQTLKMHTPK